MSEDITLGMIRLKFQEIQKGLQEGYYKSEIDGLASDGIKMVDLFGKQVSEKIDHAKDIVDSLPGKIEEALGR